MPEREFNWWELLGGLGGMAVGGTAGFLLGGPGGAKVGAGLGYGIGTGVSPGGYWNEPQAGPLKGVESADITKAALTEMEAARSTMARQASYDIQRMRPQYGGAGVYQSGARERMEMGVRERYAGQLGTALAGISIESQRAQAAIQQGDIATAMQQSELAWRKQAAEQQMFGAILEAALPYMLKSPQAADQAPSLNLDSALLELGLDPMSLAGFQGRPATAEDYAMFDYDRRNTQAYGAFRDLDSAIGR